MAVLTPRETLDLSLHRSKIQTQTLKVGLTGIADAGLLKPSRRPVYRMPRCCRRRFEPLLETLPGLRDIGPWKSEILHDTPPGPPESHYLQCSPGKPVPAEGFAPTVCLCEDQRTLVSRSLHALPSCHYPFQGASWSLRDRGNSDTTDKLGSWQDSRRNGGSIPFSATGPGCA
jgi:hypothetical protein